MRQLLAATGLFLATLAPTGPVWADEIPLGRLSAYLDGLKQVTASFTQVNSDDTISTGTIYIRRPGRVRFEYNPPAEALVIADGAKVAIFDLKTKSPPEQFPLRRTPLWVILGPDIDLTRSDMVTDHGADETSTFITAQDPEHPEIGNLQLVFTDNPVQLRKWTVTDESGAQTTVILGQVDTQAPVDAQLFDVQAAQDKVMGVQR